MSVIYSGTLRNNRLTQVVNAIDGGGANGTLQLLSAAGAVLASLPLARPCGSVAGQTLTFASLPLVDPAATGGGNAVASRIQDSTGAIIVSGLTVGSGVGSDVVLSPSVIINAGEVIAISAATITGN